MEKLKAKPQWVMWKYEDVKGKTQKVLYSAKTKRCCGANQPHAWSWVTYDEAMEAASANNMSGVGVVIPSGYAVFDFDHYDPEDPMIIRAHELLPSYTEISPSGEGEHIICMVDPSRIPHEDGKLHSDYYQKKSKRGAEFYAGDYTARYVTFTGNEVGHHDVCDCTDGILAFLNEYMRRDEYEKKPNKVSEPPSIKPKDNAPDDDEHLDDWDIICTARKAKNSEKFISLYDDGDTTGYGSQSEADLALCCILAFYSRGNMETIDRLFRESALCRDKWIKRADYRRNTIKKAIESCKGIFYSEKKIMPDFVGYGKNKPFIICPLLAEYFRKNHYMISVRDGGKSGVLRYLYQDGCYRIIGDDMLKGKIKEIIMDVDPRLLQMRDVNEVFHQIITDLNFISHSQLNTDEHLINFYNGLLDINTGELKPHSPEYLSTIQLPCEWKGEDEETPVFDKFMKTLLDNDPDVIELVLEFMGVCISNIKGWRMKKALFMVGEGDTGKSRLKTLTETLLGKGNHVALDLGDIEVRFGTSNLYGKRLAGSSDMSFMTVTELKTFKKCTGGDSLYAEFKGENGFEFVYDGLLWFCMNRLPRFGGDDGKWVYQRIMQVNCNNVIPKEKQDPFLSDKLYAERNGIVYKLVKALKNVVDNGYKFMEPESVTDARTAYISENNTVISFWQECMVERDEIKDNCTTKRIYNVYKEWCKDNNHGFAKTAREFRHDIADYYSVGYQDMIVRLKSGSHFKSFTLSEETKRHYNKAYGYEADRPEDEEGFLPEVDEYDDISDSTIISKTKKIKNNK